MSLIVLYAEAGQVSAELARGGAELIEPAR